MLKTCFMFFNVCIQICYSMFLFMHVFLIFINMQNYTGFCYIALLPSFIALFLCSLLQSVVIFHGWYHHHHRHHRWLVWRCGNGVGHINATSSQVSFGISDYLWRVYHPGIYPGHSGPLSLVIPPWVSAMSTGYGFGYLLEETVPLKLRSYGAS